MWLPWEYAVVLAIVLFAVARRGSGTVAAVGNEAGLIAMLYALWQLAGRLSVMQIDGAVARGVWISDFQQQIGFPSEASWQAPVLEWPWLVQASNLYYGGAHVPGMGAFLVWLFFCHRDGYARWRTALALSTGICLLIQLLPVAPPRLIPELGMVDTGLAYGQSVYAAFGSRIAGQLQAMPSIHVGWAALITAATWMRGEWKARAVGAFHGVATFVVVVITANHFWLDGIVAIVILAAVYWPLSFVYRAADRQAEVKDAATRSRLPVGSIEGPGLPLAEVRQQRGTDATEGRS